MEPSSEALFPRAIVHFDGDSFFASVEQALNYKLRGKPVVVGAERGAATAVSIEAKRLGISRGMTLREIRRKCPDIVVVNSDYTAYTIYARRMYSIARRFTPLVEEYSIDECFADITGLEEALGLSYEDIARAIQSSLHQALGITFGVGLSTSKVLAKTASKFRKPAGFTMIPLGSAPQYLKSLPVGSIWGIGPSMALELNNLGIITALEFAQKSREWLMLNNISKPYRQIWSELNGISVQSVHLAGRRDDIGSIQKTRTFAPPSRDEEFIFSQLAKNVEMACAAARSHGVYALHTSFFLKTQEFLYGRREFALPSATNDPRVILERIRPIFEKLYLKNTLYRATGITLGNFTTQAALTHDLFGESRKGEDEMPVLNSMDALNRRFGRDTLILASSLAAVLHREPIRQKKSAARGASIVMPIDYRKKKMDMPFLGKVY